MYRDGSSDRLLMGGSWLFRLDTADQGFAQGFARQTSTAGWSPITVPYAWNGSDTSDASQRGTVGWYRKDFRAPRASRTTSWRIRFESVNYRSHIFLNGKLIGQNEGAYVPFEVPVSKLKRGVNRLVVRADNRRTDADLPPIRDLDDGAPGGGWWNYGGILREVYLRPVDRVDLAEVVARPILKCRACAATVLLRSTLVNPGGRKVKVSLSGVVGSIRARFPKTIEIPGGGQRIVEARVRIPDPRLWEPGDPELYKVRVAARVGGRVGSSWATHMGIRSIKVSPGGRLLINSEPVTLRGASIHEDHPTLGAALGPAERLTMWNLLMELGATITRAHYPVHPSFLEMADRAGVLVWDQIPFYRVAVENIRLTTVRDKGLALLERMIRRDQNHPAVFTWSIANELASRPDSYQLSYINKASALAKRLDPTRLRAMDIAGYPSVAPLESYNRLDALGVNSYFGWYPGPSGQVLAYEGLSPYLDQVHEYYPDKAIFVTEFGAEANRHGPIDEKGTYAFQREFMQFHLSTYDSKPWLNGAVAWLLQDFRVRPLWDGGNPKPNPPLNQKGLVDDRGNKKPAFEETRRMFRDVTAVR